MTAVKFPVATRRIGQIFWICCLQYFAAELITSLAWPFPYSWANNYISDLGSVHCVMPDGEPVVGLYPACSPMHLVMNASFIVQGLLVAAGAVLLRRYFPPGKLSAVAFYSFITTGIGYVSAGFSPNDVNLVFHLIAAAISLLSASVGMTTLGAALLRQHNFSRGVGIYTLASGIIALTATALFAARITLGLGLGGIERVAFYPFPLWLALTGLYLLRRQPA